MASNASVLELFRARDLVVASMLVGVDHLPHVGCNQQANNTLRAGLVAFSLFAEALNFSNRLSASGAL